MEPLTIGVLVSSALGMASEAALKGVVGETVKDAYKALKAKVAGWAASDVDALEKTPASAARRAVVAEVIEGQSAEQQSEARVLAQRLIAALKKASDGPIGLDVERLNALAVDLGSITVKEGTGARFRDARVRGSFKTGPIDVGGPSEKNRYTSGSTPNRWVERGRSIWDHAYCR